MEPTLSPRLCLSRAPSFLDGSCWPREAQSLPPRSPRVCLSGNKLRFYGALSTAVCHTPRTSTSFASMKPSAVHHTQECLFPSCYRGRSLSSGRLSSPRAFWGYCQLLSIENVSPLLPRAVPQADVAICCAISHPPWQRLPKEVVPLSRIPTPPSGHDFGKSLPPLHKKEKSAASS